MGTESLRRIVTHFLPAVGSSLPPRACGAGVSGSTASRPGTSRPKIFISYRRADSAAIVGHIYELLTAHYDKNAVFRDINNIPLGKNFRDHVREELSGCDIVLAVIGPRWFAEDEHGESRIAKPYDPVRIEIEAALASGAQVIPVRVEGAKTPDRARLPDSIKALPALNGAVVDAGADFNHHVSVLIQGMDQILDRRGKFVARFPAWAPWVAACSALAALAGTAALVVLLLLGRGPSAATAMVAVAAIALALAAACAFAGGNAAAKHVIPGRACRRHPERFAVSAGAVAFVVLFPLGLLSKPFLASNDPLYFADQLREAFNATKAGPVDLTRARHLVDAILRIDPENGHAWYYAGEIKRAAHPELFDAGCFKGWPEGRHQPDLNYFESDFYRYREILITLPTLETEGDPGSEICYRRSNGFCVQRTAWIAHLLANDFYLEAMAKGGRDRLTMLKTAKGYVKDALTYTSPQGGHGFVQCTTDLYDKIDLELSKTALAVQTVTRSAAVPRKR